MIRVEIRPSEKCNGYHSAFIQFKYDATIVEIIKKQLIRSWNPDTKEWEIPIKQFDKLKKELEANHFELNIIDNDKTLANFNLKR